MIGLLAVAAAATQLTDEQLLLVAGVIAVVLWVIALADGAGELADVRHEIDALPMTRRRAVLEVIDRRIPGRWR